MSIGTAFEIALVVGAILGGFLCATFARANSKLTMAIVGAIAGAAIVWLAWNPQFFPQAPAAVVWISLFVR
jgi:uncharacterized membrane protein YeaQ/YmgE (transglycosylase-associated protein family)